MCVVLEVCTTTSGYPQEYVVPDFYFILLFLVGKGASIILLNRETEMLYTAAGSIFKGWEIHSEVEKCTMEQRLYLIPDP